MTYCLDTSAVVQVLRNRPAEARWRMSDALSAGEQVIIGTVALYELWFGVARSAQRDSNAEQLAAFLSGPIQIAPFDDVDARIAADIRDTLARAGLTIGPYDVQIAAQAVRLDAVLVTGNGREFGRIPHLALTDWGAPPA